MKLVNAIKKLEKEGYKISNKGNHYRAVKGERFITFFISEYNVGIQAVTAGSIYDKDDIQRDYFAGVFYNNLSQAIK